MSYKKKRIKDSHQLQPSADEPKIKHPHQGISSVQVHHPDFAHLKKVIPVEQLTGSGSEQLSTRVESAIVEDEPTMAFDGLREASQELINELGNGKDHILITSDNNELSYTYKAKVTQKGIMYVKSTEFSKKKFTLNFAKNCLLIDGVKDNHAGEIFLSNFGQIVKDLEADKAIVE